MNSHSIPASTSLDNRAKFYNKLNPKFSSNGMLVNPDPIVAVKIAPNAEVLKKEIETDAGWNVSAIARTDNREEDVFADVNLFSTGLILDPPKNFHIEVLEHPSLYKLGYSLLGGSRIINPGNKTEELIIPLYKFKNVEDLALPVDICVIMLRETEYASVAYVSRKKVAKMIYEDEDISASAPISSHASRVSRSKAANVNNRGSFIF